MLCFKLERLFLEFLGSSDLRKDWGRWEPQDRVGAWRSLGWGPGEGACTKSLYQWQVGSGEGHRQVELRFEVCRWGLRKMLKGVGFWRQEVEDPWTQAGLSGNEDRGQQMSEESRA